MKASELRVGDVGCHSKYSEWNYEVTKLPTAEETRLTVKIPFSDGTGTFKIVDDKLPNGFMVVLREGQAIWFAPDPEETHQENDTDND